MTAEKLNLLVQVDKKAGIVQTTYIVSPPSPIPPPTSIPSLSPANHDGTSGWAANCDSATAAAADGVWAIVAGGGGADDDEATCGVGPEYHAH